MSYGVMRGCVASLVNNVLRQSGVNLKVTLNILQKTAYVFGIWGKVGVVTLAKSAQHKCIDITDCYTCNTALFKVHTPVEHKDLNYVKKWILLLLTSYVNTALLNDETIPFACSIVEYVN
jgi:hypothetical protein